MKNSNRVIPSFFKTTSIVLAITGTLAMSQASHAGSSCKEMQKEACMSSASCSWIESYTTKKGNTIKAYCRNKPKQKSGMLEKTQGASKKPESRS